MKYKIDVVRIRENYITLNGWVIGRDPASGVKYSVLDEKKQPMEFKIVPTRRDDVSQIYFKKVIDRDFGFDIRFPYERGKNYWLVIRCEGHTARIKYNEELIAKRASVAHKRMEKIRDLCNMETVRVAWEYFQKHGLKALFLKSKNKLEGIDSDYEYAEWYEKTKPAAEELARQRKEAAEWAADGPLFSIVIPVYQTPEKYLRERMGFFYEYEAQEKQFFLKEKWGQFRLLYTIFYYVLVAYGTVLLIVSYRFHSLSCFSYRFYPVYGIILFGEIAAYLSGMTWQEHEDELPEEEQEAHRNDYTGLRDKYLELYGSRILLDEEQEAAAGTQEPGEEGSVPEEKKPEKGREKDAPDASSQQDAQQEEQDTVEAVIGQLLSSSVNVEQAFGDYL